MDVILKEDVAKLGSRGDVVKVAEGYGRNYLLPRKLAIEATKSNRAVIEQMKAAAQRRSIRDQADAEGLAGFLAEAHNRRLFHGHADLRQLDSDLHRLCRFLLAPAHERKGRARNAALTG